MKNIYSPQFARPFLTKYDALCNKERNKDILYLYKELEITIVKIEDKFRILLTHFVHSFPNLFISWNINIRLLVVSCYNVFISNIIIEITVNTHTWHTLQSYQSLNLIKLSSTLWNYIEALWFSLFKMLRCVINALQNKFLALKHTWNIYFFLGLITIKNTKKINFCISIYKYIN